MHKIKQRHWEGCIKITIGIDNSKELLDNYPVCFLTYKLHHVKEKGGDMQPISLVQMRTYAVGQEAV